MTIVVSAIQHAHVLVTIVSRHMQPFLPNDISETQLYVFLATARTLFCAQFLLTCFLVNDTSDEGKETPVATVWTSLIDWTTCGAILFTQIRLGFVSSSLYFFANFRCCHVLLLIFANCSPCREK